MEASLVHKMPSRRRSIRRTTESNSSGLLRPNPLGLLTPKFAKDAGGQMGSTLAEDGDWARHNSSFGKDFLVKVNVQCWSLDRISMYDIVRLYIIRYR